MVTPVRLNLVTMVLGSGRRDDPSPPQCERQQPQQVGQQRISQIIKLLVIFAQYGLEHEAPFPR
jgi:hypothetical protein